MAQRYWLMKSEPDECSIDDVLAARNKTVPWTGVRNYQARNFMRDQMQVGDGVLFYHSSCEVPGIAGIAEVASSAYPDATHFDRKSKYYDPAARREVPRWMHVDVRGLERASLVRKAVRKGNPAVVEFARAIARQAGDISTGLIRSFQPDIVLLGGGLMDEMREEILGLVEESIRRGVENDLAPARVELFASVLGDLAGMTGGAVLAAQKSAAILR